MKVFDPEHASHTLRIIPREYVTTATLLIRDEAEDSKDELVLICTTEDGYLVADFNYDFREGQSCEITVSKADKSLIYRGKAYATVSEDLQNYKLTDEQ